MQFIIRAFLVFVVAALLLPESGNGSVVFKPGQKAKYVSPGEEEEISGDAAHMYQIGQTAEKEGNIKRAIRAYKSLVRHHPKDTLAPGALYRSAQLQEQLHDFTPAAESFSQLVEKYPGSPHFEEAIEAQFRIGEIYLNGKKLKFLGIPLASALDRAVTVFANVVRTAPYGKYTARAQFDIGLAREKQGANDAALQAYQAVVDKFPTEPVAVDAQYQIGYIWFTAAQTGTKDAAASANAKTAFQDFLFHYPKSEKTAQARANLDILEHKQTANSYKVAKFYDKQKYYRAAVIYYNEVIRQQPGSEESNEAKGEAHGARTAETGSAKPGAPNNDAPLPAPETDSSLPPPASLAPDTTTAPEPLLPLPGTSTGSDTSPGAGASASPDASASPAP
jgi:outer membrane protein assembly factor BamD